MAELVQAGKVRADRPHPMVSVDTLRRGACECHPLAAVQSEYSLVDPRSGAERGCLRPAASSATTFVAYSPLGRAFLAGAR